MADASWERTHEDALRDAVICGQCRASGGKMAATKQERQLERWTRRTGSNHSRQEQSEMGMGHIWTTDHSNWYTLIDTCSSCNALSGAHQGRWKQEDTVLASSLCNQTCDVRRQHACNCARVVNWFTHSAWLEAEESSKIQLQYITVYIEVLFF